ncbi:holo-ACP synthase [Pleurocapsa sp. FMAR1]|uniref:holo-ACP synthase n=1 Tax=Pleurocapsa sp. FMAR1 TaxID=3040204 RepID=UPI0029C95157|nr:4'-phosphopantetheinyl transferase superfamily protein [Pleurocapsa sp. FMAR1]
MHLGKFSQLIIIEQEIYFIEEMQLRSLQNRTDIFSAYEQNYCLNKPSPLLSVAGLWCAKQAFIKATNRLNLNFPDFNYLDLEVRHRDSGQPKMLLQNKLRQQLGENINVEIAIAHEKTLAVASVVFWRNDRI